MTDKEPTQGQIKEFWERCGAERGLDLDLNNLFKYGVPVALNSINAERKPANSPLHISDSSSFRILMERWTSSNPMQFGLKNSLFWTIWEVIHAK